MTWNPVVTGVLLIGGKTFSKIIWWESIHPYLCRPLGKKGIEEERKKRDKFLEMWIICEERSEKKKWKNNEKKLVGNVRNTTFAVRKKRNSSSKVLRVMKEKSLKKLKKFLVENKKALNFATPIKKGRQKKPKDLWKFGSNST